MIPLTHPNSHAKRHLDRFSHFCTIHGRMSLYFTIGSPFSLKIALSHGASGPPSNIWFLRPTRVHNPNSISINLAVFAVHSSRTSQTERQTRHTPSVTVTRVYIGLRRTVMRQACLDPQKCCVIRAYNFVASKSTTVYKMMVNMQRSCRCQTKGMSIRYNSGYVTRDLLYTVISAYVLTAVCFFS